MTRKTVLRKQKKTEEQPEDSLNTEFIKLASELQLSSGLSIVNRTILLSDEIDDEAFEQFDSNMCILESLGHQPIELKVSSNGGSTSAALAIVGRFRASPCKVVTIGFGTIASAATIVLAAGRQRYISRYAYAMLHQSSWAMAGTAAEHAQFAAQAERERQNWNKWMSEFCKKPIATFDAIDNSNRDTYFNANECVALGLVDEVLCD